MQAMILAAGFGTRLKPFSLIKPKPLFPVLNSPLLLATISRLKSSGFTRISINCHHLRDQIVRETNGIDGIVVQEEKTILGTGGGLRQAVDHLRDEPLLVTNGDIYHTVDFKEVYQGHVGSGAKVTMVLHDFPRFNTVTVHGEQVVDFDGEPDRSLAFTGIQVIDPVVLLDIKKGTYSCIIDHYRTMLQGGRNINARIVQDIDWSDMGTPRDYLALHGALLTGQIPIWPEFGVEMNAGVLIDKNCEIGQGCSFEGWATVGDAQLGDQVVLCRSVVWEGARVTSRSRITDGIVAPGCEKFCVTV